jgi:hypothetical protein
MDLRKSLRHHNLLVSKCGQLFYEDTMERLMQSTVHGLSTRGPAATYREPKQRRIKQISVSTEVLETWVIERRTKKGDYCYFKDGDTTNCHIDNIILKGTPGRRSHYRNISDPSDRVEFHNWNDSAIYC